MLAFPNAKINLGLYVIEKRPDGFHNIETVFFPVPLNDILEILPLKDEAEGKIKFTNTGIPVDCKDERNLCVKAYDLLDAEFNLPAVEIILHKAIPMGAGLGGGSSDGAYTLWLLNKIFSLGLSKDKLSVYASKIGSDCPFFIYNTPMLGTGKGELLTPVTLQLQGHYLVLVKPSVFVGTNEAYKGVKLGKPVLPLAEIVSGPVGEWKNILKNNFEENIFPHHPEIEAIKNNLYNVGALYACMSGSGSTVFGIFDKPVDLAENFPGCFYWMSDEMK